MNCSLLGKLGIALGAEACTRSSLLASTARREIVLALFLGGADAAQDRQRDDLVAVLQAHAAHAGRGAALEFADVGRRRSGSPCRCGWRAGRRRPRSAARRRSAGRSDRPPRRLATNRIAILPRGGMLANASMLLRRTAPWAVANTTWSAPQLVLVLGQRQHGRDRLALGQRQQVDHRPARGVAGRLRAGARPSCDRPCRRSRRTAPACGSR